MATRWIDKNGNTVEVMNITHTSDNSDGQWFIARTPNERVIPSIGNARGWYRNLGELRKAGIDLNTLKEVRRVLKYVWEEV